MEASATAPPPSASSEGGIRGSRGLLGRLVLLAAVLLLAGQIALAWFAVEGFERELEPQLSQKGRMVGLAVADQIRFAVDDLGIPPDELVGVDPFFDEILATNSDIEYMFVLTPQSEVLFASGLSLGTLERMLPSLPPADVEVGESVEVGGFIDGTFPVVVADGSVATVLHVGTSKEYVRGKLSEILYEVITVIVISWLVTLEFLMFFMNTRVFGPMGLIRGALEEGARGVFANRFASRARDETGQVTRGFNQVMTDLSRRYEDFCFDARAIRGAQIDESITKRIQAVSDRVRERYFFTGGTELRTRSANQIRVPLFLFIFAEELSRSFLPLFISRFSPSGTVVSDDLLIGLPITLFMLVAAAATPIGGRLADRFGARPVFLSGITFAVVGYVGTFFVYGYYDLLLWRMLVGAGYGLLYITAQAWVTENSGEQNRARGMAVFAGAVFVGAICGPPIGSIIADRIGFEATFLISAGLSVFSGLIVYRVLNEGTRGREGHPGKLGARQWMALFADRGFLSLAVFAALPSKLVLTGFLFYVVPLYLSELGTSQTAIGWVVMLYGVATVAFTSVAARFADHSRAYAVMVLVGGALPAVGCLSIYFQGIIGGPISAVVLAVIALGLGHALALTSQLALAQAVADRHRGSMGPASVIAVFRLVERGGLVLGPVVASVLSAYFGYEGAMIGIGLIMLGGIATYAFMAGPQVTSPKQWKEKLA